MKVAIHQPHYFPWMGYFDKMAKVDKFIIMDDVQLVSNSSMIRNKFLDSNGNEIFLSLSVEKNGYLDKKNREIKLSKWEFVRKKHKKTLYFSYKKAPYFDEIWNKIENIFEKNYENLIDLKMEIIEKIKEVLDIKTEIIFQSSLDYDKALKASDLVLDLCLKANATMYLSGQGGKKYMKLKDYEVKNIKVEFQQFFSPEYKQVYGDKFIPNLSVLDFLFNNGIEKSRRIFWENIENNRRIE